MAETLLTPEQIAKLEAMGFRLCPCCGKYFNWNPPKDKEEDIAPDREERIWREWEQ